MGTFLLSVYYAPGRAGVFQAKEPDWAGGQGIEGLNSELTTGVGVVEFPLGRASSLRKPGRARRARAGLPRWRAAAPARRSPLAPREQQLSGYNKRGLEAGPAAGAACGEGGGPGEGFAAPLRLKVRGRLERAASSPRGSPWPARGELCLATALRPWAQRRPAQIEAPVESATRPSHSHPGPLLPRSTCRLSSWPAPPRAPSVGSSSHRTGMERPLGSCLRCCLAVLILLPALSLAQYESWPSSLQYPEYFQQPAPEYQQPQVPSDVVKIQLRLAGQKRKHSEGRVEVYYDGQWGTVCDDDFSIHAAHVVCRELGYVEAKSWTASSSYGRGEGPIWLDNVYCTGKEATLAACTSNGWGVTDCKHTEDVGVVCSDKRIPGFKFDNSVFNQIENLNIQVEDIRIRPVLSAFQHRSPVTEGFVEVKEGKTWKQICDKHWTAKNAHVVCGMFGFPGERTYNAKAYKMVVARRKKLRYWPFSMDCTGTEAHISSCKLGPQVSLHPTKNITCENGQPAVVSCVPGQVFSPDGPSRFRKAYKPEQPLVRLRGGAQVGEGRVEVLRNGEWGTICDDKWDLVSASVVCRELGFGSAKEAVTGSRLGQGIGPIHLNEIECTGSEKSIVDCKFNAKSEGCSHEEDAGVRCNIPAMGFQKKLRLNGGRNPFEGRVEVLTKRNGSLVWGTVCGENWGIVEAMVVCRQLGLGFASNAFQETWYWHGDVYSNKVVMSGVKCSGTELSLEHCRHDEDVSCPQGGVQYGAGVACSETAPDLVLNAEMVQQTAYLEDRPMIMLQCAMEENCLSASAALTDRNTGYRRLLRFSSQIHNNGQSDFRPKNGRHAWIWHDCHRHYHSMEVFTHYDLLNLNGTKVAQGHKASFCLEDTECEGDIQKSYECANFGEQGITMGCWDMYRHDIDCQWVDITDVPPGDYLFQVVINPNYEVSESDYSNNIMKCRCRYDGHRIWMYNCHIGGSFSDETEQKFEHFSGLLNNQLSTQ